MLEISTTKSRGSVSSYLAGKVFATDLEGRRRLDCDTCPSESPAPVGPPSEEWWSLWLLRLLDPEVSGAGIETGVDAVGLEGGLTGAGAGVGPGAATEEVAGVGECVGGIEESEAVTGWAEMSG